MSIVNQWHLVNKTKNDSKRIKLLWPKLEMEISMFFENVLIVSEPIFPSHNLKSDEIFLIIMG